MVAIGLKFAIVNFVLSSDLTKQICRRQKKCTQLGICFEAIFSKGRLGGALNGIQQTINMSTSTEEQAIVSKLQEVSYLTTIVRYFCV